MRSMQGKAKHLYYLYTCLNLELIHLSLDHFT